MYSKTVNRKRRIFAARQVLHEKSKTDFSWDQREVPTVTEKNRRHLRRFCREAKIMRRLPEGKLGRTDDALQ